MEILQGFYEPAPKFLVVDFGSEGAYRESVAAVCDHQNMEYYHVEDYGVFSLGRARNLGFKQVKTDLVFFTDIDFIHERNFFGDLARLSGRLDIATNRKRLISMPAYHVSESETSQLTRNWDDCDKVQETIAEWSYLGPGVEAGNLFEFVAPYSNRGFNFEVHTEAVN